MKQSSDLRAAAGAHARDLGEKVKSAVADKAGTETGRLQDEAARQVEQTADAAGAAARAADPGSVQAQAANQVASHLEGIAEQIRTTDINETVRKVSDFARQNPALFIGAAAVAGFAATRFLKARSPEGHRPEATGDPWAAPSPAGPHLATRAQAARHPDEDTLAHVRDDTDHHTNVATAAGGRHGSA